jgi:hypothetical protein
MRINTDEHRRDHTSILNRHGNQAQILLSP